MAILFCLGLAFGRPAPCGAADSAGLASIEFYGEAVALPSLGGLQVPYGAVEASPAAIDAWMAAMAKLDDGGAVRSLLAYRRQRQLDDWLYYQLVRRVAESISPKKENYIRYTLYKYWLLAASGYDVRLRQSTGRLLFYARTDEEVFNIPAFIDQGKQYVCLNYHDYKPIDFNVERFTAVVTGLKVGTQPFSYKVTQIPDFKAGDYVEKELRFAFYQRDDALRIKLNPALKGMFANYPVVDYELAFNMPLSGETRKSLVAALQKNMRGMRQKEGVDYLMRFTRYAFGFERDSDQFGTEKRLTPEQTLLYNNSDCEDRTALFYYLVKELYNLPMIVLTYPQHVTIAVKLDRPVGKTIQYNGAEYTVCEPTPQASDLSLGQLPHGLRKSPYSVAFAYQPR